MYSCDFPNMFQGQKTLLLQDNSAAINNLMLLLASDKRTLFGDPFFGTELKKYLFDQNSNVVKDIVIDQIYSAIITYVPQIIIKREDIDIKQEKTSLYASIKYQYINSDELNTFDILLMQE